MGNWLTQDQARLLLEKADGDDLRGARDIAMISVLIGCGLRRAELSALTVEDLQIRQGRSLGTPSACARLRVRGAMNIRFARTKDPSWTGSKRVTIFVLQLLCDEVDCC